MDARLSESFKEEFIKLTKRDLKLRKKITEKIDLVSRNPSHPSLRLHKILSSGYWSVSVDKSIRILLIFKKDFLYLIHIGTHDQVY